MLHGTPAFDFIDIILTGDLGPLVEVLSSDNSFNFQPIAAKNTTKGPQVHEVHVGRFFIEYIKSILDVIFDSEGPSQQPRLKKSIDRLFKNKNIAGAAQHFGQQQVHFYLVAAGLYQLAQRQTNPLAAKIIKSYIGPLLELSSALRHLKQTISLNGLFHDDQQKWHLKWLVARLQRQANKVLLFHGPNTEFILLLTELIGLLSMASVPQLSPALFTLSTTKVSNILAALEDEVPVAEIYQLHDDIAQPVVKALIALHRLIAARPFQDCPLRPHEAQKISRETMDGFITARNQLYAQGAQLLNRLYDHRKPMVDDSEQYELLSAALEQTTAYFKCPFLANTKTFKQQLFLTIHQLHNKPDHWQQFLGCVLMVAGTVFMGLSIAALFWSGGTSVIGIKVGYGLTTAGLSMLGGFGIFKHGEKSPTALSNSIMDIVKRGQTITSRSRGR